MTHFAVPLSDDVVGTYPGDVTLCGQPWQWVIENNRPPTCKRCVSAHKPWTFPLPPVVA